VSFREEFKLKVFSYPSQRAEKYLSQLKNRVAFVSKKVESYVKKIGNVVKKKGDLALIEYTKQFDGVNLTPEELKVTQEEVEKAYDLVDSEVFSAIKLAVNKVKRFHEEGMPSSWVLEDEKGIWLGQLVKPVSAAGIYIPGGKGGETPLISTVVMTAVPAKVAGVEKVVMVSPPRKDGSLHPALLVAAKEAGVSEIYKVGGPWAIFALAYGTSTIPKVDVICGPGNIFVTTAKKLVSFEVGIDLIAGPSEVVVIADESAKPEFVAWDLLAQAEHDPLSLSVLITTSRKLARAVKEEIKNALTLGYRSDIVKESLSRRGAIIVVKIVEEGIFLANEIAPEHLELAVENPFDYLPLVKNAGAVFLGHYTPEAVGDYIAGPNHVLPTMGFARFSSALSAEKFCKKVNFVKYSQTALADEGQKIIALAEAENLPCHAQAVKVRLKN